MVANEDLIGDILDELFWDPKVHNERIAVDAEGGKVTPRGTVGSPRQTSCMTPWSRITATR
jgi:hypothetical protein